MLRSVAVQPPLLAGLVMIVLSVGSAGPARAQQDKDISEVTALPAPVTLTQPVQGAFGIPFGAPVSAERIAATTDTPPYAALPANLVDMTADAPQQTRSEAGSGWVYLDVDTLPPVLQTPHTRLFALLTSDRLPVRLVALILGAGCKDPYEWLAASLLRKYEARGETAVTPRAPHLKGMRLAAATAQIDLSCGQDLLLEYTDLQTLGTWRVEQNMAQAALEAAREAEQEEARRLARANARLYAETFTLGSRARLDGALGIPFGQPYVTPAAHEPDKPFAITPPDLPETLQPGRFTVMLDPEDLPIELAGRLSDPAQRQFAALSEALEAKYGKPLKDTSRHRIFRINGNFFVLRALPAAGETTLTVIDGAARKAQRERMKAMEAAEVAALEARFKRETEGL